MILLAIGLILLVLLFHANPYLDIIEDNGIKHYLIWYTNFKSERVYIDIIGS